MRVNCQEHSKTMELLALKQKLTEEVEDKEARKELEKRIEALEKELGLD